MNNKIPKPLFAKRKPIYGVAYLDIDTAYTCDEITEKACSVWRNMLLRCYCKSYTSRHPTYIGCTVCDEWLYFSNFKKWFEKNYIEGNHLDKDLLSPGNGKIYSPETCCFLPRQLNCTFISRIQHLNKIKKGVSMTRYGKYAAFIHMYGKTKNLGHFDTAQEAHLAYTNAHVGFIKELAIKFYRKNKITKRVYDALMNYKVEITD